MNRPIAIITLLNLLLLITYILYKELSSSKIVYVDSQYLLNNYKGMIAARDQFQRKTATWKANIDTLRNELNSQIVVYQRESPSMTPKEKKLSEELIAVKQKQFLEYESALNVKAQQEDEQMTRKVLDEVNTYIRAYGLKNGYLLILAATEYGNIAYANERYNVTEKVLTELNKEYAGK